MTTSTKHPDWGELKPCPFCDKPLYVKRGKINPYARCATENCFGAKMPVVSLDVPADVEAWNTRTPTNESPAPQATKKTYIKPLRTIVEINARYADQIRDLLNVPAPQPPVEGLRGPTPIKQLGWQETFVDRGDGATEQSGWEADNGFSSWYSIEQYFASDSYGWQVKFDCDVIGDFDDPDQAKACAQSHFETRILAALASPSLTAGAWQDISTAPKDGTHVLVCDQSDPSFPFSQRPPTVAHWFGPPDLPGLRSGGWYLSVSYNEQPRLQGLTHWQPLPPTPATEQPSEALPSAPREALSRDWKTVEEQIASAKGNELLTLLRDYLVMTSRPGNDLAPLYIAKIDAALSAAPVADREAIARVVRLLRTLNFNYRLNDCDDRPNDDALEMPMTVFREANAILALLSAQPAKGER